MQDSKAKNSCTNKSFASEISAWTCINAILYIPSALPLSAFCLHGVTPLSLSLFIIILSPFWILRKTEEEKKNPGILRFRVYTYSLFVIRRGKKKEL